MKVKRLASTVLTAIAVAVPMLAVAAPAHADPDTDFQNELHIYGIYGEKDYNAWIGKIACKRLYNGLDKDANASAQSVPRRRAENLLPGQVVSAPARSRAVAAAGAGWVAGTSRAAACGGAIAKGGKDVG